MRKAMLTLALVALSAGPAGAQGWAEKMFKEGLTNDFGNVPRGSQLYHRFPVTNIYAVRMEITSIEPGCGCVTATAEKRVLEPLETTTINVTMDARRFTGSKTVAIKVKVGPEHISSADLRVSANSRADVVFNPGQVSFGSVPRGQKSTQSIDVEYAGTLNWTVTEAVVGKDAPFEATFKEIYRKPGQVGYKVEVTLKPDAPTGNLKDFVYLKTNDPAAATVPVLVDANVQSALTVTPGLLNLGSIKVNEALTRRVVLRGSKPFKVTGIEGGGTDITLSDPSATAAAVQTVTFKCQLTKPGEFKRELQLKTDLQDSPITVILEGVVMPQ